MLIPLVHYEGESGGLFWLKVKIFMSSQFYNQTVCCVGTPLSNYSSTKCPKFTREKNDFMSPIIFVV